MAVIDSAALLLRGHTYVDLGGGSDWLDESGNNYDGVITGATFDTDHFVFDAAGEKIVIADNDDLDIALADNYTLMVVVEHTSLAATQCVVSKKNLLTTDVGYAIYYSSGSDRYDAPLYDTGGLGAVATTWSSDVLVDTKYVVAQVANRTDDDITIFWDGVPGSSPPADPRTATSENAYDFIIGQTAAAASPLTGYVYAVAFWTSALSDADVVTAGTELLQTAVELTATISSTSTVGVSSLSLSQENAFTLIPDGDQTGDSVINEQGSTSNTYLSIDDDPDSPDLSDYVFTQGVDGYKFYDLSATPGDFSAVTSLRVRADVRKINISGFTVNLYAQVFNAAEDTNWTDEVVFATQATSDGLVEASYFTINATGLAATKPEWDAARVKVRWDYT